MTGKLYNMYLKILTTNHDFNKNEMISLCIHDRLRILFHYEWFAKSCPSVASSCIASFYCTKKRDVSYDEKYFFSSPLYSN